MLGTVGIGVGSVGVGGCLRLQGEDEEPTADGETSDTGVNDENRDGGEDGAGEATLVENWTAEPGIEYIWTDGGTFYFNGYNAAAEAAHGSGLQWADDVSYDGATDNLAADAFGTDGRYVVFGYIPDPDGYETIGGHFHAYDAVSEEKVWTFGAPSDGKHNFAIGATVVDDVAVVATTDYGPRSEQEPLVAGIDLATGEELWRTDRSTLPRSYVQYLGSFGGSVYVGMRSEGAYVLDPDTGSLRAVREDWDVMKIYGESCGQIHGQTFFAASRRNGIGAYPIGDTGVSWRNGDVGTASTAPAVDNSLVVVGTDSGDVHALDRETGESQWDTNIGTTVGAVTTSALRVWVADRDTGLTAYDRSDGTRVHRSTKPVNRSALAVIDDVLLLGGNGARAYWIE